MPRHRLSKRLRRARSRVLAVVVVAAVVAEAERREEEEALWPRGRGGEMGIGKLVWVLAWACLQVLGLGLWWLSSR